MLNTRSLTKLAPVATTLALALSLGLAPAEAATNPVTTHVKAANNALATATARVKAGTPGLAARALPIVTSHTQKANAAATALIGKPPTDPESDDVPGPPAVIAALKLDNRVTVGAVALLNNQGNTALVSGVGTAVQTAQARRNTMLNKVIALPAEGARADYDDSMADTLGIFAREVKTLNTALTTYTLTPAAEQIVAAALARSQATKAKVDRVWGGGERPALAATQ